jgi:hypothetical protein
MLDLIDDFTNSQVGRRKVIAHQGRRREDDGKAEIIENKGKGMKGISLVTLSYTPPCQLLQPCLPRSRPRSAGLSSSSRPPCPSSSQPQSHLLHQHRPNQLRLAVGSLACRPRRRRGGTIWLRPEEREGFRCRPGFDTRKRPVQRC